MDQWWGGKGGQGQGWGTGSWKGAAWKGAQPKHQGRSTTSTLRGGIIQRLDQDLLHTRGDIQQLRTEKEQLTAEKNQLIIEKNQLRDEKDAALARATVAEKMVDTMTREKQEMVDKHAGETAKASSMLTEVNAAWQRDTKQWEDRLKTTKRMLEESEKSNKKLKANQDSEYSLREKLRGERDAYKTKSERLEKTLETEQRDLKIASSKLKDVEKENGRLKKRLSRLESQLENA
ncbi:unnamed protein product [Symbiodinium necroappetens]|uniref:Uncharacterized protein n=1 Tax=Symbiodinium necroappetens TaxID=1628268 RepID=A0A812YYZ8_9DINO|nr:unnamed protein product [Symbiodinium necroappetens]